MKRICNIPSCNKLCLKTDINKEKEAGESINKNLDHKAELGLAKPFKRSHKSKTCDNI